MLAGQNIFMTDPSHPSPQPIAALPSLPIVMPLAHNVIWITADGEVEEITRSNAVSRLDKQQALYCHKRWTAARQAWKQQD